MSMSVNVTTAAADQSPSERSVPEAMKRGATSNCPACGKGPLYREYLKVQDHCPACNEPLHHQRADDAPAYFTIFIVSHIVIAGLLLLEQAYAPSTWVHIAIWIPLLLALSLFFLPIVKGALVGLQWALRMHGFGEDENNASQDPTSNESY